MPTDLLFEKRSPMPATPAELFAWHARPGAFARLAPPWQRFEVIGGSPEIAEGSRVVLRMAKGPLRLRWVAEHRNVRPGEAFRDVQVRGPFALWEHDHLFEPDAGGGAVLHDRIRFRPPAGALGRLLMEGSLRRDLEATFRYRHATTAADLELHRRYRHRPRLRVAVTGAGGLVGRTLTGLLTTGGHQVVRLARPRALGGGPLPPGALAWEPERGLPEPSALGRIDALFHLAGESIAHTLIDSLARLEHPPRVLVVAPPIGVHDDREEGSQEEAALDGRRLGMRVVLARLGLVLSPAGGFLARTVPRFRLGLGGPLGEGGRRVGWISIDDAAAALLHLVMSDELEGPIDLTAPQAPSHRELAATLGRVLGRPAGLRLPSTAARLLVGAAAACSAPAGPAGRPSVLETSGFAFRHPRLEPALRHLLGRPEAA